MKIMCVVVRKVTVSWPEAQNAENQLLEYVACCIVGNILRELVQNNNIP